MIQIHYSNVAYINFNAAMCRMRELIVATTELQNSLIKLFMNVAFFISTHRLYVCLLTLILS